jgi:hypothetical protein
MAKKKKKNRTRNDALISFTLPSEMHERFKEAARKFGNMSVQAWMRLELDRIVQELPKNEEEKKESGA